MPGASGLSFSSFKMLLEASGLVHPDLGCFERLGILSLNELNLGDRERGLTLLLVICTPVDVAVGPLGPRCLKEAVLSKLV